MDHPLLARLDAIRLRAEVDVPSPTVRLRRRAAAEADVQLFFPPGPGPAEQRRLAACFVGDPGIAAARWTGSALGLRLADELVEDLGHRLQEHRGDDLVPSTLLAGRSYAVQYLDPNACKGLHVGHLYDAVIGHGLASMLAQAGARVHRHDFVCDMGRNVCEAMAGHRALHDGTTPEDHGLKPDHFVGRAYAAYVAGHRHLHARRGGDPIGREDAVVDDEADDLLRRWGEGDPEVRALWRQIRGWVVAGHEATLARVGSAFDRYLWGSEVLAATDRVVAEGLRAGVFEPGAGGTVVHHSGREDYGTLVILRGDGFPTEHGRQLGLIELLQDEVDGLDAYITVEGEEWKPACAVLRDIRSRLGPCRYHEVVHRVHHGMVLHDGAAMTSSGGDVLLADELLDRIVTADPTRRLVRRHGEGCTPDAIARIVAVVHLLSRPLTKPVNVTWDGLLSPRQSPGWRAAAAWCHAVAPDPGGRGPIDPTRPADRLAIVQAQGVRGALADGATGLDLAPATDTLRRMADLSGVDGADAAPSGLVRGPVLACLEACGAIDRRVSRRSGRGRGCGRQPPREPAR